MKEKVGRVENRGGVKSGSARDVAVRRGGERNRHGRWMWPFPSTRCRPASDVTVCCRFGSFSG